MAALSAAVESLLKTLGEMHDELSLDCLVL